MIKDGHPEITEDRLGRLITFKMLGGSGEFLASLLKLLGIGDTKEKNE